MAEMKIVTVGTQSAIDYAELAMHESDLREAVDVLGSALSMVSSDSLEEQPVQGHLINAGLIAYWRCFPSFEGKPSLTRLIALPDHLLGIHQRSRQWRNNVVAHNDSAARRSLALVALKKVDVEVFAGLPATWVYVRHAPIEEARALLALVEEMLELVVDEMVLVSERMVAELGEEDLRALWDRADNDDPVDPAILEWDPSRKRLSSFVRASVPVANHETLGDNAIVEWAVSEGFDAAEAERVAAFIESSLGS